MSFLLTSFPISGYFKTSHSHADPRLSPQAWSGWKLPLWLPWLCNLMVPGDRRQVWKREDSVQNLEHHVPLLGCSKDFITPGPWFSHSYSGKTDGSRLQLCALHGGNSNTVCSCICMTALRISCLKTKAMFSHICILQHLPHWKCSRNMRWLCNMRGEKPKGMNYLRCSVSGDTRNMPVFLQCGMQPWVSSDTASKHIAQA